MVTTKKEDEFNYNFLLKCLAGIAASALLAVGIIMGTLILNAFLLLIRLPPCVGAPLALFTPTIFSVATLLPLVLGGIGAVAFLGILCAGMCSNNRSTYVASGVPAYTHSFFAPPAGYVDSYSHHGHTGTGLHTHSHTAGGNVHGHFGGTIHGHTGGFGGTTHGHTGGNTHGHGGFGGMMHGHH